MQLFIAADPIHRDAGMKAHVFSVWMDFDMQSKIQCPNVLPCIYVRSSQTSSAQHDTVSLSRVGVAFLSFFLTKTTV